ncbi:MAG: PEP-CTERM system TPR-repeat protein PrsT [Rubrivivax sp.]
MSLLASLRLWAISTAIVLASACSERPAQDSVAAAEKFIANHDFGSAVVELKRALAQDPSSGRARYLMGAALVGQGMFPEALTELNKALELGFDKDEVRGKHALALIGSGRVQELVKEYESFSIKDPAPSAEVRTALAVAYMSAQQIGKAEQALDDALAANPKYGWALLNKARIELYRDHRSEAAKLVDSAIATRTVDGEAWFFKGAMLQQLDKDLVGAEKAFRESAKDSRFKAIATNALASLYVLGGKLPELRALHAELAKASPGLPGTVLVEAQIAYMEKRYGAAREALDKLLRTHPTDPHLLLFSGGIDLARGAYLQAETYLGKAVQHPAKATLARRLLALTYLRMGQPEKALATIKPILDSAKVMTDDLALAGEASLVAGQLASAENYYTAAVKQKPQDVGLKSAVALIDLAKGRAGDAFDALQRLAEADPGDIADKALISAHMRRREFDAALAAISRMEKKKSDPADVALLRGLAQRAKGDVEKARAAFELVLKNRPEHYLAAAHLAEIEAKLGQVDEARARIRAVIAASPRNGAARLTLASLLESTGAKPDEVRTVLSDAVSAVADDPGLRVALVTHLLKNRDPKSALAAAQQAAAAFPVNVDVLDALGRALGDSDDFQQAVSTFGKISSLNTVNPMPYVRLADLYARRKSMNDAAKNLRKAFELAPELREVHVRMLALAKMTGDSSLPMTAAKDLQKSRPNSLLGYFLEGDALAAKGNWTGAISAFKAALGKPDPSSAAPIRVFDASLAAGQTAGADKFAAEWLKAHPQDRAFIDHVGLLAIERRKFAEAEQLFSRSVELNPNSAAALNNLAWARAKLGVPSAVETAERALALAPRDPNVLDTLASAWASQKNFKKAVEVQSRAVALAKGSAPHRVNLVRHLLAAGDKVTAKSEFSALIASDANLAKKSEIVELKKLVDAP